MRGVNADTFEITVKKAEDIFSQRSDLYHEKGAHKGKMKGEHKDTEKQIAKNKELGHIYGMYQKMLRERRLYDYADMIMETYEVLKNNEDLLLRIQEQYQYFLVDEHQDTNNAQNKILELLASHFAPNPNLFVVGDEKQSIFRFQGASLENFYYFKHLYPSAELITLTQNYRSSQSILDSAHSLIAGDARLEANAPYESKPIDIYPFSIPTAEYYFVAESILRHIEAGVPANEIAVLYRDNKDVDAFAGMFEKLGIAYNIESDQDIYSYPLVKTLLVIARAVHEYGDDRALADFLHLDLFDIEPLEVYKAIKKQSNKVSLYDVIGENKSFEEITPLLSGWVKRSKNTELVHFFEELLRESGLLKRVLSSQTVREELDILDTFFAEIRSIIAHNPDATLDDFFTYLSRVREHKLSVKKKKTGGKEGFVRCMTAHRSKGQEFQYVYIIRAHDGKWGNKRKSEPLKLLSQVFELLEHDEPMVHNANDDERRLFYVALTRAKERVFITYARENEEGREQQPSQFMVEVNEDLTSTMDTDEIESSYKEVQGTILETKPTRAEEPLKDKEYINELFTKQELSVSALNNYLSCPWKYFYRNLIRLPEPEQPHLMFGNAIHSTLDYMFRKEVYDTDALLTYFENQLATYPLTEADYSAYKERGREALSGWLKTYNGTWGNVLQTEMNIRGIEVEGVVLRGVLDKVVQEKNGVVVVDYKTGKPKTRNTILGKTKDGKADIWRQLVFYRLLLDMYKGGKYHMEKGVVDFIEPQNDKWKKEEFEVSEEDVEELKETIKEVAEEITTLAFWNKRCGDKDCEYCKLREMIA